MSNRAILTVPTGAIVLALLAIVLVWSSPDSFRLYAITPLRRSQKL